MKEVVTIIRIEDVVDRSGEHARMTVRLIVNELVVLETTCREGYAERWAQREYMREAARRVIDEWFKGAP